MGTYILRGTSDGASKQDYLNIRRVMFANSLRYTARTNAC